MSSRIARLSAFIFCSFVGLVPIVASGQVDILLRPSPASIELREQLTIPGAVGKNMESLLGAPLEAVPLTINSVFSVSNPLSGTFQLTYPDSAAALDALRRLSSDSRVSFAQWNHRYQLDHMSNATGLPSRTKSEQFDSAVPRSDDLYADSLEHFRLLGIENAWKVTKGVGSVRVGLIDTGIFLEHPDLDGQVWINEAEDLDHDGVFSASDINGIDEDGNGFADDVIGYDFVDRPRSVDAGDFRIRDPDPRDDGSGHGTSVAGVISARANNSIGIAGIAPGVRLVVLRAFASDGRGDDDDIAAAIVYAADSGIDVLNLSFGDSYYSPLMHESIKYATAKGVTIVASAGNVGGDDPHYPSDYPEVLSTVWLDSGGAGPAGRATFGVGVDIAAPGSQIFTTLMPGAALSIDDSVLYGRQSGSSMAAPMVAATAALLRSVNPSLTSQSIRAILTSTAIDLGEPGWDHRTGAGRVNPEAAVLATLPARATILQPSQNDGFQDATILVVGSVVSPSLVNYTLSFAEGDQDLRTASFTPISGPTTGQVFKDTLAVWDISTLPDGLYTLRLSVRTTRGTMEDRRRISIDRTPPEVVFSEIEKALVDGSAGIHADIETDDLTSARLEIAAGESTWTVRSDRLSKRHGIAWSNSDRADGPVSVRVVVENTTGLSTTIEKTLSLPAFDNALALRRTTTLLRHGFLLPDLVDLDEDGLPEIVYNSYRDGWLGDTLTIAEFSPDGPRIVGQLGVNVFPRDVGDSNGNGKTELLTQVSGATVLFEQTDNSAFPSATAFIDTTGLVNPTSPEAVWGARLTDLDDDGRGEILSHNTRSFRILEFDGVGYTSTSVLANSTGTGGELADNSFQQPEALVGDFDNDGKQDIVVGDSDGDWLIFESIGDNSFKLAWSFETDHYNAGARFAAGDLDGDGNDELLLTSTNWIGERADGVYEPAVSRLYLVQAVGDDEYVFVDTLSLPGESSQHNGLIAADLDGDGRDEVIIIAAPDLYVLQYEEGWRSVFHWGRDAGLSSASGARSAKIAAGDLDANGRTDLLVAGADEYFHRLEADPDAMPAGPVWLASYSLDSTTVFLKWHAPGSDSVLVYSAEPDQSFDVDTVVVADNAVQLQFSDARDYFLVAYSGESPTAPSAIARVVPHTPARGLTANVIDSQSLAVTFSMPMLLASAVADSLAFIASENIYHPESVILTEGGFSLALRFGVDVGSGRLSWQGLRSFDGAPATSGELPINAQTLESPFHVQSWDIIDTQRLSVTLSEPVDIESSLNLANYLVMPFGGVTSAAILTSDPRTLLITLDGIVTGPTALNATLEISGIRSIEGDLLRLDGNVISLSTTTDNLVDAYVFPNPVDPSREFVTIAGLPLGAEVEIIGSSGSVLLRMIESSGNGGLRWDLRNDRGEIVPSGVYLVRVSADNQEPRLLKVAIIR